MLWIQSALITTQNLFQLTAMRNSTMTQIKEFKLQVYGFDTLIDWQLIPANIQGPTAYIKAVDDENVSCQWLSFRTIP